MRPVADTRLRSRGHREGAERNKRGPQPAFVIAARPTNLNISTATRASSIVSSLRMLAMLLRPKYLREGTVEGSVAERVTKT
jgi:hypothetical protein